MRGMGRVYRRGPVWWIAYYHNGRELRESARSERQSGATRLLRQRLREMDTGRFIGPDEHKLLFEELVQDLIHDYTANNRKSLRSAVMCHVRHLREFFALSRALDITPDKVKAYQALRLEEGAARSTVNREVACLRRMLSLAVEAGKLSQRPTFHLLDGERVRQGFLEHRDFLAIVAELPQETAPIVEFLYWSGWRKGEVLTLQWRDVDLAGKTIRLRIEHSKTGEPRVLPLYGRLHEVIAEQRTHRRLDCPFVFHRNGQRIGDFKKAWKAACLRSGQAGVLVHDLRRCAARNLSRAGVPESVAMEIMGHKTRSMFRRYRIVSEQDLWDAAKQLHGHLQDTPPATISRLSK